MFMKDITFSIKNDSSYTIVLHTGKAEVSIHSQASYKFTKPLGTTIFLVEEGEKTTLLLTVEEHLEGKKFNFLDLMKKK